jgi:tetratricopeptide (TPR) repeat protein
MEPEYKPNSPKWPKRLALLFILLYAIFWSLGPFFSRTLFALAGFFSFMALYTSVSVRDWLQKLWASGRPQAAPRFAPRPTYQATSVPGVPTDVAAIAKKILRVVRFIIIGVASIIFILFLIGIFLVDEEPAPAEEETVVTTSEQPVSQVEYFTEKGNTAMNNGLTDSAHYYYDKALSLDPQNVYALYDKGLAYILSNDYYRGNALTRRCLRYHSDYDQAWWLLGYSYDKMNNTDSALYCLEKAKGHDYSDPGFLELLGEVYEKKGRRNDAVETYQKLVTLDTTKADIYRKLAVLDPTHAREYLQKAEALGK